MLKQLAILAAATIGATAGGMAHARDGVQWSVTLASPFNLPLPPVPVITVTRPAPVYAGPAHGGPVYGSPVYGGPVYGSPVYGGPVYGSPVYGGPVYGGPVSSGHDRRWDERTRDDRRVHGGRGWRDADHDGIPNRYDRVYNPRWDRDGDGVPNRDDRHDRNPHRR